MGRVFAFFSMPFFSLEFFFSEEGYRSQFSSSFSTGIIGIFFQGMAAAGGGFLFISTWLPVCHVFSRNHYHFVNWEFELSYHAFSFSQRPENVAHHCLSGCQNGGVCVGWGRGQGRWGRVWWGWGMRSSPALACLLRRFVGGCHAAA